MVQPLIDFIVSKKGIPFLVIITAICHIFSSHFFDCHSFFMLLWTVIGSKIYMSYIALDLSAFILNKIDRLMISVSESFSKHLAKTTRDIAHNLQEVGQTLTTGTSFAGIAMEFSKHKIGLGLCAKTLTNSNSVSQVVEEAGKISSLLGLETSIVNSTLGRLTSMAGSAIEPIEQHGLEDIEKFIPLIASTAAMADLEIGDVEIGKHMDKFARNTKSAEIIAKHVRQIAEASGVIKPQNWQILQDLNQMLNDLKEDHIWVVSTLGLHGSEFVNPKNYERVKQYRHKVDLASKRLRSINIPEIKNNQIITECNQIIMKAQDYLNQIESIRQCIGLRPVPVGICIQGPSQIGKTTIVRELMKRVKTKLQEMPELFGNPVNWAQWDANQREDFDSGYCGQEIVYMDDAFQDKTNKDHLMWYTYISSTCVGTIQGIAEQKGLPFRALICITTCNEFPRTSVSVSHINALHERFPLSYRFKKIKEFSKWNEGGSDFDHISIESSTMSNFVSDIPERINSQRNSVQSSTEFPKVNLNEMVDQIVAKMVDNMTFYNLRMSTATTVPTEMHSLDSEESEEEESFNENQSETFFDDQEQDEMLDELFGNLDSKPHCRKPHVSFDLNAKSYSSDDIPSNEEEDLNVQIQNFYPLEPVHTLGSSNSEINMERIVTAVAQDINSAYNRAEYDTIDDIGDWTQYLVKIPHGVQRIRLDTVERFNAAQFRLREDGLYDFLATLGAWKVLQPDRIAFEDAYMKQRILKCADNFGTEFLWGPTFELGTCLYLVSPSLGQQLDEYFMSNWRRRGNVWKRKLIEMLTNPTVRRHFSISAIPIAGQMLFPNQLMFNEVYLSAVWLRGFTSRYYFRGIRSYWNTNLSVQGVLGNVYSAIESPFFFVAKSFEYFEKIAKRLARGLTSVMLQLLEYFGVDVAGYWQEIANITTTLLSEVIVLSIASILIYIAYRLIKTLFPSKETIEMHESKNEFGKGSKRLQQQRRQRDKNLVVRGFERRSFEEFQCKEECENQDQLVEIEETLFTKIGTCNDIQSFYGVKPIEYCVELLKANSDAKYCEFIRNKNSHIVASYADSEDFLIQKIELIYIKKVSVVINKSNNYAVAIQFNIVGTREEIFTYHKKFTELLKHLNVLDWQGEIYCRKIDNVYHFKIYLVGLTTSIQGTPRNFVRSELKNLNVIAEKAKGLKECDFKPAEDLFESHGSDDSMDLMKCLVERHQVFMSLAELDNLDSPIVRKMTYGIGHQDIIIFNAHVYAVGEYVRFWRYENRKQMHGYQVCHVESIDIVRDIGFARIINKERLRSIMMSKGIRSDLNSMASMVDRFRSVESYLCDENTWRELVDDQTCLCFLPTANALAVGRISIDGLKNHYMKSGDQIITQMCDFLKISQLNVSLPLARKGDCGGLVLSFKDRYQSKIIGFHCGGTAANWFASILRKEDLVLFTQHGGFNDPWDLLIVPGQPIDLPSGPFCTYLGKYRFKTKPAGVTSLSHWRYSPFHQEFEEQLQPGPLDANDPRIQVDLPTNSLGEKSLLLTPNSIMCSDLPKMDSEILDICKEQITKEMAIKIGYIKLTPSNIEKLLEQALNGARENVFCTGMEIDKACGLPWNELKGCSKKKDFLKNEDGYISFLDNINGQRLKNRVILKLEKAREGDRIISLSNSKLKDALIKISAVEQGKTRVFHCIPVDKVICDSALFGNFKESYSQAFLKLNHAIGVNPHSTQWKSIYEHLNRHPNVFDMDFSNYDKRLHGELMQTAFEIIREVIQINAKDDWDEARWVLQKEAINTYVVDYDTVYETKRGNKSGEYLTTIVNCICNDILSFYIWIKVTRDESLSLFRRHVSGVSFGDDKIESVSDQYADLYNYFSAKEVMSSIGHIITPGAKDGIERKFCSIEQAQFLKRGIIEWEGIIAAPLLQRSIESPFVWTQIENSEEIIWFNLVEQQLFEAVLHGKIYFDNFVDKLKKCIDFDLRCSLASLLSSNYELVRKEYLKRYYNINSHLCISESS